MISKHQTVMNRVEDEGVPSFTNHDPDFAEGLRYTVVTLDKEVWKDMGSPDVITLSVEPGDLLNPQEDA